MNFIDRSSLLFLIFLMAGCQSQPTENIYNTDTLKISGKAVVFLTITRKEFDAIPKQLHPSIDTYLDNFFRYSDMAADSLKLSGYKLDVTANRFVNIKLNDGTYRTFDRLSGNTDIVGFVLTDGVHEPLIKFGITTDSALVSTVHDFMRD